MKKNIFLPILLAMITVVVSNSCKKPEVDTETQSATDNAVCEGEFTSIVPNASGMAIKQGGINAKITNAGPYITVDSINYVKGKNKWPRRMRIDFDRDATGAATGGYTDPEDGKFRKGIISLLVDTSWSLKTAVANMKIDSLFNYSVNGINYKASSILISRKITSGTANASVSMTTTVNGGKCWNSSWTLLWNSTRTFTYDASGNVTVSGSADGTNKNGLTYTTNINNVVKLQGCANISSGTVDLTPAGKETRIIDYGVDAAGVHSNTCDDYASLTIKGNTFIFKLN